ncbi:hypothetical protein FK531_10585 [Rhodococcus spelaei]|uniref:MftR C-terminal domain-containing protein n=1 Tax=Rhodococcus spelaei TaxID=2546320 RepID=A0A541BA35_9NOCA|nr:hypothetical protein FK531_10585 [Rhodococcus spelaei]
MTAYHFGDLACGDRFLADVARDTANPSLQERELLKLATLGVASADALRHRGVPDPAAVLAAETGVTVFKVAFEEWIGEASSRDFPHCVHDTLEQIRVLVGGG